MEFSFAYDATIIGDKTYNSAPLYILSYPVIYLLHTSSSLQLHNKQGHRYAEINREVEQKHQEEAMFHPKKSAKSSNPLGN
jgi:hypothetical protein